MLNRAPVFLTLQYCELRKNRYSVRVLSNSIQPAPYNGPYFPAVSYEDNM
jgi:hypothetical protein